MKRILTLTIAIAGLTACATAKPEQYTPVALSTVQVASVEQGVKSTLRDPDSARFSNVRAARGPEGLVVCGLVNAKNGFGGYAGDSVFIGKLTQKFTVGQMGESTEYNVALLHGCANYGLKVTN